MREDCDVRDLFAMERGLESALETIHAAFGRYRGKIKPESGALSETFASLIQKAQAGAVLGVMEGDRVIACVCVTPKGEALYLDRLAVHPDHQGQGLAKVLVTAVEAEARHRGLNRVTLSVRLALPANIALFERLGFVETGRSAHAGFDVPTSMDMEKRL